MVNRRQNPQLVNYSLELDLFKESFVRNRMAHRQLDKNSAGNLGLFA